MKLLSNPLTPLYLDFKQNLLSDYFPWFWSESSTNTEYDKKIYTNISCYSHTFLTRPEKNQKYSNSNSNHLEIASEVFKEILNFNNIKLNMFIRISANCTHAYPSVVKSVPHVDHEFYHKNIIIYFTNSGGDTFVGDNKHSPKENEVLLFEGIHHYETPIKNRRIISVATFI